MDARGLGAVFEWMLEWRVPFFFQFFRKYLTPVERADVIMVAMEAMTSGSTNHVLAASKMLKIILKYPLAEVAKVGAGGTHCFNIFLSCLRGLVLFSIRLSIKNPKCLNPEGKSLYGELFCSSAKGIFVGKNDAVMQNQMGLMYLRASHARERG